MKVSPELHAIEPTPASNAFVLPDGLIGFSSYRNAELLYNPQHLPFLWMRLSGPAGTVNFVVLEPGGVVPGYEIELFEADATRLDLTGPKDALVLNIVTLNPQVPLAGTVNLIGPIVVNRRTGVGRQLVIVNHAQYSARHALIREPVAEPVGA